ncbi:N-6 DNA Methylase [Thalassobacillus cyri]|uniref:site-specific DNA-methyltransferase (adenine-specific) n=1 Tax=Thalassobacillus cyri TaxID=571932 RepID=A0A1H3VYJ7_9BACI|nr:N-6 DNA methylase [Thalassobacillus cyri]SDZ79761.1 N-6 DNA Methylase [Thalassobacillus cyri]
MVGEKTMLAQTPKEIVNILINVYKTLNKYSIQMFETWSKNLNIEKFPTAISLEKNKKNKGMAKELFINDTVTLFITRLLFLRLLKELGYINESIVNDLTYNIELNKNGNPFINKSISKELNDLNKLPYIDFERFLFERKDAWDEDVTMAINTLYNIPVSKIDEEILGDVYQYFLNANKRKHFGEYYTPRSVVDYIVNETILNGEPIEGDILDPSCGFGTFLTEAVRKTNNSENFKINELVGFDINNFAVTLTRFFLIWTMLKEGEFDGNIENVSILNTNSLEKNASETQITLFENNQFEKTNENNHYRDEKRYKYIVGNPPYIRAERLKNGKQLKAMWGNVWGQNGDTAIVFLYRILKEWIEKNGKVGLVLSGGISNSTAAESIRNILAEEVTIKQIIWLEFSPKIWDASAIPMILIIENKKPNDYDIIKTAVPSEWPSSEIEFQSFYYKDYFSMSVNPSKYILPLLETNDIPILEKLDYSETLGEHIQFKYGIQRGSKAKIFKDANSPNSVKVVDGKSMFIAGKGPSIGWVDIDKVQKKSLWNNRVNLDNGYIALPGIILAPTAVYVEDASIAALDTSIVATHENKNFLKAATAYLNSNIIRYLSLISLRAGVMEGSHRLHMYPRTVEKLPFPYSECIVKKLAKLYDKLSESSLSYNQPHDKVTFMEIIEEIDNVVAKQIGLCKKELNQIKKRLSQKPLDSLIPRYPWMKASERIPNGYEKDRYKIQEGEK